MLAMFRVALLSLWCAAVLPLPASAGVVQKAVSRSLAERTEQAVAARALAQAERAAAVRVEREAAMRKALAKDLARDSATPPKPLTADRRVFRYTSTQQAKRELKDGIGPGTHMTARASPGRPPLAGTVQRQLGLPKAPEVRLTVRLTRGTPVRHNKALVGEPGRGEITAPALVRATNIEKVTPLQR